MKEKAPQPQTAQPERTPENRRLGRRKTLGALSFYVYPKAGSEAVAEAFEQRMNRALAEKLEQMRVDAIKLSRLEFFTKYHADIMCAPTEDEKAAVGEHLWFEASVDFAFAMLTKAGVLAELGRILRGIGLEVSFKKCRGTVTVICGRYEAEIPPLKKTKPFRVPVVPGEPLMPVLPIRPRWSR